MSEAQTYRVEWRGHDGQRRILDTTDNAQASRLRKTLERDGLSSTLSFLAPGYVPEAPAGAVIQGLPSLAAIPATIAAMARVAAAGRAAR